MQSAAPFLLTSKKGHVLVDNGCGVVAQARLQNLQHPGPGAGYNKVKMITGRRLRSFWISAILSCMNAEVILYTPPNTSLTSERPETDPPHVDSTSDAAIQQHSASNRNNAIQDRLLDLIQNGYGCELLATACHKSDPGRGMGEGGSPGTSISPGRPGNHLV